MKKEYESLFTPWKVRELEIKNRIVLAPMGGTCIFGWMEPGGNHFDREAARLLRMIAKNNCGLIIFKVHIVDLLQLQDCDCCFVIH